jgi:hypothetical protein
LIWAFSFGCFVFGWGSLVTQPPHSWHDIAVPLSIFAAYTFQFVGSIAWMGYFERKGYDDAKAQQAEAVTP